MRGRRGEREKEWCIIFCQAEGGIREVERYRGLGDVYKGQGESTLIHLQIACENTENKPYLLMPRSSIAKTPLRLSNSIGLIDSGYRGEIMAAVDNIKKEDYTVDPGQRLFQLVAMDGAPIHFELVDELSDTSRGSGGFGSTGK